MVQAPVPKAGVFAPRVTCVNPQVDAPVWLEPALAVTVQVLPSAKLTVLVAAGVIVVNAEVFVHKAPDEVAALEVFVEFSLLITTKGPEPVLVYPVESRLTL